MMVKSQKFSTNMLSAKSERLGSRGHGREVIKFEELF